MGRPAGVECVSPMQGGALRAKSAVSDRSCAQGIATRVCAGGGAGEGVGADGSRGGGSTRGVTRRAVGVREGGPVQAGG
jgi:hypothetical protein